MHSDRTNRAMLIVLALTLIAAGAAGVAASYGLFGLSTKHTTVLHNHVAEFIGRNGDWLWPVATVVALLVVLLALRWLLALLFSTDRTSSLRMPGGGGTGRTELVAGALTDAVSDEIDSYAGVHMTRARIVGDPQAPELVVTVTVEESADLPRIVHRIEAEALAHARTAVGDPSLPTTLDVTVTTKRATRVS